MYNLIFIISLSLLPFSILSIYSRDLPFFLPNILTDNQKMLIAAKKINIFDWPSKMHKINNNRSQSREYWTMICSILVKFFKGERNDFVTIFLGLLANFISTILIYQIFSNYFDQTIGLLASLFYLTSFWSYHVCLFIGHVILAQMFFLIGVLCLQISDVAGLNLQLVSFLLAGSFAFIGFASSSASLKYPPLSIMALIFAIKNDFSIAFNLIESDIFLAIIPLIYSIIVIYSLKKSKKKYVVKKLITYLSIFLILIIILLFLINITYLGQLKILSFFLGFSLIFLHVTLPAKDFFDNVKRIVVWRSSLQVSHFLPYPKEAQIKLFKRVLPKNFRGGDMRWNFKVYNIFMPLLFPIYLLSVVGFLFISLYEFIYLKNIYLFKNFIFFFFLSCLPTLIHEFTKGLKVAKAYYATFIIFLIFPFIFINHLQFSSLNIVENLEEKIIFFLFLVCAIQAIHTFFIVKENLNSRLFVKHLYAFLLKNKINEFSTYKTKYNEYFVDNMVYSFPNKFKINIINNLKELKNKKNKILIVPPITSKAFYFNTNYAFAIDGNFNKDPDLVDLIRTKKIEKYAIKKFITMSSYKFYIYDDEVLSFRSIYLNQIKDEDRYKGHGWAIDLDSLWT